MGINGTAQVLSYTSLVGIAGEFFVAAFMLVRFLDGSYQPDGEFYKSTSERDRPDMGPDGEADYWGVNLTTFVLLGTRKEVHDNLRYDIICYIIIHYTMI